MPINRSPDRATGQRADSKKLLIEVDQESQAGPSLPRTPDVESEGFGTDLLGAIPKRPLMKTTKVVSEGRKTVKERAYDPSMAAFIFEADNLVHFCTKFSSIPIEELTTALLEANLDDINGYYDNVKGAYRKV